MNALVWALRAVWLVLPVAAGPALADGLDEASSAMRTTAAVGLWAAWAAGLVATLVPHPISLTVIRVVAPAGVAAAVAAAVRDGGATAAVALGAAAVVTVLAFSPVVGQRFVDGASWGEERRLPLRVPGLLLLGPLPLAWAVAVSGLVAGPLLLAARRWVPGTVALASGVPLAVLLLRALHGLARRWVVFVPAGLVLHDPMTLADPVLFPRRSVTSLGPALVGTDALDLTQRATGLALELGLDQPAAITLVGGRSRRDLRVRRLLFTPTRPGELLAEARRRRFPVG